MMRPRPKAWPGASFERLTVVGVPDGGGLLPRMSIRGNQP